MTISYYFTDSHGKHYYKCSECSNMEWYAHYDKPLEFCTVCEMEKIIEAVERQKQGKNLTKTTDE